MTLFILVETPAGFALMKAKDKKLLKNDNLASETDSAEGICSLYVAFSCIQTLHGYESSLRLFRPFELGS